MGHKGVFKLNRLIIIVSLKIKWGQGFKASFSSTYKEQNISCTTEELSRKHLERSEKLKWNVCGYQVAIFQQYRLCVQFCSLIQRAHLEWGYSSWQCGYSHMWFKIVRAQFFYLCCVFTCISEDLDDVTMVMVLGFLQGCVSKHIRNVQIGTWWQAIIHEHT